MAECLRCDIERGGEWWGSRGGRKVGRSRAPFSVEAQVPQQALQAGTTLCPRPWLPLAIQSTPCLSQEYLHTLPSVAVQWELETPGLLARHRVREQSGQVLNSMVTLPAGLVSNSSAETVYLPLVSCLLWECQEGCHGTANGRYPEPLMKESCFLTHTGAGSIGTWHGPLLEP